MKLSLFFIFICFSATTSFAIPKTPVLGYLDAVSEASDGFNINGWSCQSKIEQANTVNVYAESSTGVRTLIGSTTAKIKREDGVKIACKTKTALHGFDFKIPKSKYSGLEGQKIRVWGVKVNNKAVTTELGQSGSFKIPGNATPTPPPPPSDKEPVLGYLGEVTSVTAGFNINGWSCQSKIEEANTVNVYAESPTGVSTLIGSSMANTNREDAVRVACKTKTALHGFDFTIPKSNYTGLEGQKIRVWGVNVNSNAATTELGLSGSINIPGTPAPIPPPTPKNLSQKAIDANNGMIMIMKNEIVLIDKSVNVGEIHVQGKLICPEDNRNIQIISNSIHIHGREAALECGSRMKPFLGNLSIQIKPDANPTQAGHMGERAIGVMDGGTLSLHGNSKNSQWTKLSNTILAGEKYLNLASAMDWNVGDEIAIGPTNYNYKEAEQRVITAISADKKTITLDKAVTYQHYGAVQNYSNGKNTWALDSRAEVINLTRNIQIMPYGDKLILDKEQFGAHIMVMNGAYAYLDSVELIRMGQMGVLARYPFHWHRAGDIEGQYIKNSSIHKSYQRCITVHGSHRALVENNVCYDHFSHGYFLEDGDETYNRFYNNVGMLSKRPPAHKALLFSDHMSRQVTRFDAPATFWVSNPKNYFKNNVASGSQGTGFWMAFEPWLYCETFFCRTVAKREEGNVFPSEERTLQFDDNIAHSANIGFNWDGAPTGVLTKNPNNPNDRENVSTHYSYKGPSNPNGPMPIFNNLTAYKNVYSGIYYRGDTSHFKNFVAADNGVAIFVAFNQYFIDSLIVGLSKNSSPKENEFQVKYSAWQVKKLLGFLTYDGPTIFNNVYFAGFPENKLFALGTEITPTPIHAFGGSSHFEHSFSNITFEGNPYYKVLFDGTKDLWQDIQNHLRIADIDGSFYGSPGSKIVMDYPIMMDSSCTAIPRALALKCFYEMGTFVFTNTAQINGGPADAIPFIAYRNDGAKYGPWDSAKYPLNNKLGMILGGKYSYKIQLDPKLFSRIGWTYESNNLLDMSPVFTLPGFKNCTPSRGAKVNSLNALNSATKVSYYIDDAGLFYFRDQVDRLNPTSLTYNSGVTFLNCSP